VRSNDIWGIVYYGNSEISMILHGLTDDTLVVVVMDVIHQP
jgi:hypothetical protein